MSRLSVFIAVSGCCLAAGAASGQTTWYVDDDNCPGPGTGTQADPFCMIQDAIDAAVNGDECVVAPGTYNELIDFVGKAITLRSSHGAEVTTIDGAGLNDSVVKCVSAEGADTVLDGFTITGGNAGYGGGMFNYDSSPTVTNCTFSGNTAAAFGGGMNNWSNSSPTVSNCTFSGNLADWGGGMFNVGSRPTVTNCTFSGNTAGSGGGINNRFSSPIVTNCTFSGNSGDYDGAMINGNSSPTVTNCTFSGNLADYAGGGMYNGNSNPTVTNCTFSGNSAGDHGGGMTNSGGSPAVTNCTFSGNLADWGGGMYNGYGSPTVTNCILWGNIPSQVLNESSTPTISHSDVQGGMPGVGNIDADPLFVDADGQDDIVGTEDDNLRLMANSPAIDAADNTAVPIGVTTDLDGNPRFVDDPATPDTGNGTPPIVDMGAYEFLPPCGNGVVDPGEECDDGNTESGDGCSESCQIELGACCVGTACSVTTEAGCPDSDGTFYSFNSTCDAPDADGDGLRDECDGCPGDGNKIEPGICGCGVDDSADSDADGVPDCDDRCAGVDDTIFAPECEGAIPTVSGWGLIITALLLVTAGKVWFGRVPLLCEQCL